MLVTCQMFGDLFLFGLVRQYSSVQTKYNKGRFKVMATYLQHITLNLPSYTGSALKRELNFCNDYLSLLYFCQQVLSLRTSKSHRNPSSTGIVVRYDLYSNSYVRHSFTINFLYVYDPKNCRDFYTAS